MPENLRTLNTLQNLKFSNNCSLMVEEKSDEEIAAELASDGDAQAPANNGIENINDSDNMRTVIVQVKGFDDISRFQVNLDWTLTALLEFLIVQLDLGEEQRLRDLTLDRMYFKEEMGNKLRNYETFQEGGTRL